MKGSRAAAELREARERAGLSLPEAAARTRIPQRYLEALEAGDHSVFPPGPFLGGYTRQYRGFLQLPATPASEPAPADGGSWFRKTESARPAPDPRADAPTRPSPQPEPAGRPGPATRTAGGGAAGGGARSARRGEPDITTTSPASPSRRSRRNAGRLGALAALATVAVVLAVNLGRELLREPEPELGAVPDQRVTLAVEEPVRARVEVDGRSELDGSLLPGPARTFAGHDKVVVELETLKSVSIEYNDRKLTPLGGDAHPRRLVFIDDAQQ